MSLDDLKEGLRTQNSFIEALRASNLTLPGQIDILLCNSFGLNRAEDLKLPPESIEQQMDDRLVSTGKANILNVSQVQFTVEFVVEQDKIDFVIRVDLQTNWQFKSSFPKLPESTLDKLSLENPSFLFATKDVSDYQWSKEHVIPLMKRGQNVAALLKLEDVFKPASKFLPPGTEFLLYTHLDVSAMLDGKLPELEWSGIPSETLNLPDFLQVGTSKIGLEFAKSAKELPDRIVAYLEVQLQVNGNLLPFRAVMQEGQLMFTFEDMSGQELMLEPRQVFSLMTGFNWFKWIPAKLLNLFTTVLIKKFEVRIQLADLTVKDLTILVTSEKVWPIDYLNLNIVPMIEWYVDPSRVPEKGDLVLKGILRKEQESLLELTFRDDLTMEGGWESQLDPGIDWKIIQTKFGIPADFPIPSFSVTKLKFRIEELSARSFSLTVSGPDVKIANKFILDSPSFQLRVFPTGSNFTLKWTFTGTVEVAEMRIPVTASFPPDAGQKVELCGELVNFINLKRIVISLLGDVWPGWLPEVQDVPLQVKICFPMAEPITNFELTVGFPWELSLNYLKVYGAAKLIIENESTGTISSDVKIKGLGAEIKLYYKFEDPPKDTFTVIWERVNIDYNWNENCFAISLSDWTVGKLLTNVMKMTGNQYFQLPEPLAGLMNSKLSNILLGFELENSVVSVTTNIDDFPLIKRFSLRKDRVKDGDQSRDRVMLVLVTNILEQQEISWDLADSSSQPDIKIPGFAQVFDLRWLALGQRVSLKNMQELKDVEEAVCQMKSAFQEPPWQSGSGLKYDSGSNWLIGTDFGLLKLKDVYFLDMQIIFNDPNLYGLRLALDGELADIFKGLEFEVRYQKKGSHGVYAGEITLPDHMRYLQFGAVEVTLPVFSFKLFTNGDFEVDVGFPYNLDFSRSLMIQVPPYYMGAGGFYFAKLSNGDQSERLPKPTNGKFGQILEFGLGMALGIGRDINKGILKAGFNVSAVGIFEGVLATFHGENEDKDRYYKITAMVGIIGRLYGSVTFPLIRSDINVAIGIVAETIVEAYRDLLLNLIADVDVSASIKINLGFKKIKISYSFKAHLEESFSLGGGSEAPWKIENNVSPALLEKIPRSEKTYCQPSRGPEWKSLTFCTEITLYFVPHLFVEHRPGTDIYEAGYVAMLYMTSEEFEKLASAIFLWVLQAFGHHNLNQDIYPERVEMALEWLQNEEHGCHIDYAQLKDLLKNNFRINIQTLPENALEQTEDAGANVFPMIPELTLHYPYPDHPGEKQVDFAKESMCSPEYLKELHQHFEQMRVRYLSKMEREQPKKTYAWTEEKKSLATVLFEDYFVMIAKNLLQNALDEFKVNSCTPMPWEKLNQAFQSKGHYASTAGMATYLMMCGMRPPVIQRKDDASDCEETETLYRLTGQQFLLLTSELSSNSIKLSKSQQETEWICLNGRDSEPCTENELLVTLEDDDINRIVQLRQAASIGVQTVKNEDYVQPMPMVQQMTKVYSLTNTIPLIKSAPSSSDGLSKIWFLPNSVLQQLACPKKFRWGINQKVRENNRDKLDPINNYNVGTLLNVSLKKLAKWDSRTGMKIPSNTYELVGTDEAGTTLLERMLVKGIPEQKVYLLYPQNPEQKDGPLTYEEGTTQIILKTNLSTETNPPDHILGWNEALQLQNTNEFIQWLWECSIVRSGGFYLHRTGVEFPENIFDEEGIGSIGLLLLFENKELLSYVNCVVNANPDSEFLYLTARHDISYRVQAGDTLASIAHHNELHPLEMARMLADQALNTVTLSVPNGETYEVQQKDEEKDTLRSVAFMHRIPIEWLAWNNLDVQQIFPIDVELLIKEEVKEKAPTMPSGNVGFMITRQMAEDELEDQDMQTYLEHQYAHLGYWVAENQDFNKSCEGLPIAAQKVEPKPGDSVLKCQYQKVVPVHPFAKFNSLREQVDLPSPDLNPYAGIGSVVRLDFIWRDLFGNGLDLPYDLKIQLGYTDRIIGFEQWPSLILNYHFSKKRKGKRELVLDLKFDRSRYKKDRDAAKDRPTNNKSTPEERAMADKITYAKIYYQLCQQDREGNSTVKFTVQTSIDQKVKYLNGTQVTELQRFIKDTYKYLHDLVEDREQAHFIQPNVQLVFEVSDSNQADVYELDVRFSIERPLEHVDVEFRDDSSVSTSITQVPPRMEAPQKLRGNENSRALKWFADQFEKVFDFGDYHLKIAVGESRYGSLGTDAKKIWVVRLVKSYSKAKTGGIAYSVQSKPIFYAPLPLSTKLVSREVKVRDFDANQGTLVGEPESGQVSPFKRIDMDDQWARQYLEAIEEILSPSIAVQAFRLVPDVYRNILQVKESLATQISNQIDSILKPSEGDSAPPQEMLEQLKAAATEKLRQQLLINLTNAYDIETVVVYMASVRSNVGTRARLYGQIVTESYQRKEGAVSEPLKAAEAYSTSKSKIDLQTGKEPLAFTFNARTAEYQSHFKLKLSYQVLFIEHEIGELPGIKGYEASSWLTFVNPLQSCSLEDDYVEIPIPLRAYPEEPSMIIHEAVSLVKGDENEEATIQDSVKWAYQYKYARSHAAQDKIISKVRFNLAKGEREFLDEPDLFDALAQFIHVYPGIKEALNRGINTENDDLIKNTLNVFYTCIKDVEERWTDWFVHHKSPFLAYDYLTYTFEIKEEGKSVNGKDVLKVTIVPLEKPEGVTIPIPKLLIDGYEVECVECNESQKAVYFYKEIETGKYLELDHAFSIRERWVIFENLNILILQNIWSTMRVIRNRDLVLHRETNELFVYETPEVGFAEKLTPLLDIHATIRVAEIDPTRSGSIARLKLEEHIYNLFETLFADLDQVLEKIPYLKQQTVKVETRYEYPLEKNKELPPINLPITLLLPGTFNISSDGTDSSGVSVDQKYIENIVNAIQYWFSSNQPQNNGQYRYDLSVFSNLNETKLPLLRLRNLVLDHDGD